MRGQAARVRVLGGGLRLLRGQPAAADRGRARRAAPTASTTRPRRPSSRRCSPTSCATSTSTPTSSGRASWPGPTPSSWSTTSPTCASPSSCPAPCGGCSTSCRSCARSSPTPASATSSSTTTTSPPRCARRPGQGRARHLQPRRRGRAHPARPRRGVGLLHGAGARAGHRRHRRGHRAAAVHARRRPPGSRPSAAHADGHEQGAQAAALAPQAHGRDLHTLVASRPPPRRRAARRLSAFAYTRRTPPRSAGGLTSVQPSPIAPSTSSRDPRLRARRPRQPRGRPGPRAACARSASAFRPAASSPPGSAEQLGIVAVAVGDVRRPPAALYSITHGQVDRVGDAVRARRSGRPHGCDSEWAMPDRVGATSARSRGSRRPACCRAPRRRTVSSTARSRLSRISRSASQRVRVARAGSTRDET